MKLIRQSLEESGITPDAVQLVEDPSHAVAEELMQATDYVDVLIPRGGAKLIQTVKEKQKYLSSKQVWGMCTSMWMLKLT